jgi:hypothetical protein
VEETEIGDVRNGEQGSALVVVLVALALTLPLALLLMSTAFVAQRQARSVRDLTALDYAVRAGFGDAQARLATGRIDIAPDEASSYETIVDEITVRVRVERQPDVVLSLDGGVLEGPEARAVDLDAVGFDPTMRRVRQYRLLEVYLVESRAEGSGLPMVRLSAVLAGAEGGPLKQVGLVVERGYFDEIERRGLELGKATRIQ